MQIRKISPGSYEITDKNFRAKVQLNARDCMNAGTILELPMEPTARATALTTFRELFYTNFGAKNALSFETKLTQDEIRSFNLQKVESSGAVLTTRTNLTAFIEQTKKKEKISTLLSKIDEDKAYEFISDPIKLAEIADEIYAFKSNNASFASDKTKQQKGIYSPAAESAKSKNPFVQQFILRHHGKIIATNMYFTSENVTYESDIIVHKDYRNQGYCQVMMLKAYEDILKKHPKVELAWIIAGGDGKEGVGVHLYRNLLQAKPIDETMAHEHQFVISYTKEGPMLLKEANRDLTTGLSLDAPAKVAEKKPVAKTSRVGMFATFAVIGAAALTVGGQIVAHIAKSKKP